MGGTQLGLLEAGGGGAAGHHIQGCTGEPGCTGKPGRSLITGHSAAGLEDPCDPHAGSSQPFQRP